MDLAAGSAIAAAAAIDSALKSEDIAGGLDGATLFDGFVGRTATCMAPLPESRMYVESQNCSPTSVRRQPRPDAPAPVRQQPMRSGRRRRPSRSGRVRGACTMKLSVPERLARVRITDEDESHIVVNRTS